MKKITMASAATAAVLAFSVTPAMAMDEITVAYFLEWPMPFLAAKADGTYEEELGVKINWRSFETGTAMSAAMAAGDVQMSVSQGVPPFVVAASAGQDIQVVDMSQSAIRTMTTASLPKRIWKSIRTRRTSSPGRRSPCRLALRLITAFFGR